MMLVRTISIFLVVASSAWAAQPSFLGNNSCATSTCHGGVINQGPAWNHSLSTWAAKDPHAGAGLLLRDDDSRAIVTRLNAKAAESEEVFDTVLRQRCISCHATPTADQTTATGLLEESVLLSGVTCEACHGPASEWVDPHLQLSWAGPQRFEPETGMRDTESIIGRASTCVRCHIGSRSEDGLVRDMNHDIVAAGHPALRFDLLLYNESLPKHWDVQAAAEVKFNESPIRTRKVARAMNLAAAATLSTQRASAHLEDKRVPWPEFADYDCFACHQSLSIAEYKLPPTDIKSPLHVSDGLPVWNSWHTVNQLELRGKRDRLLKLSPHKSKPNDVIAVGGGLAKIQLEQAAKYQTQEFDTAAIHNELIAQLRTSAPVDWHEAAVQYLEEDAVVRELESNPATAAQGEKFRVSLNQVEKALRFDPVQTSGQKSRYNSPTKFDPAVFQELMLRLPEM